MGCEPARSGRSTGVPIPQKHTKESERQTIMEKINERNADILRSVERWQTRGNSATGRKLSLECAVRCALREGAPRFYLKREHVWKRLHERRRRLPPHEKPHRRKMWQELEQALEQRLQERPGEGAWEALDYVLECVKPSSYFITEHYALKLVQRQMRSKHNNKRAGGKDV